MSVAQMTAIVLPQVVSRSKGIIINISSILGKKPNPLFSAYSASKAFGRSFSQAVGAEYFPQGVLVQTVNPLMVESSMTADMKYRMAVMNAEDYVRQAVDTLGLTSQTSGCLTHAVQSSLLALLLPDWFSLSRWGVKLSQLLISSLTKDTHAAARPGSCSCASGGSIAVNACNSCPYDASLQGGKYHHNCCKGVGFSHQLSRLSDTESQLFWSTA